ncbi:DUF1360 domain-containing protein [Dehalobacterium formicoaceticum]|uniref:DUF1360 domain-containing protein n=1 Tax=Dehalobacterium formicoaceticum TaxID=51515 RepID=UPI000B7C5E76|nr:DUF1360 domain-containing protein [Dehalobacterium formicoaceticum]
MIFQILLVLSIRFFLFDFVLFKNVRTYLSTKGYVFWKLLSCPFCQGFWCGLGVFLVFHPFAFKLSFLLSMLSFGFVTAYLSLMTIAIFYPLIDQFEDKYTPFDSRK